MNWRLSVNELKYVVEDCEPKVLFCDEEFSDVATEIQQSSAKLQIVHFGESSFPPEASGGAAPSHTVDQNAPFLIVYTSGTTGRPKGAVLSQKAISCSAEMSQHMTDLTVNDRVLNVLPLFHIGGLNIQPLPALLYGATLVLHARFNPSDAVDALAVKQITLINTVPTLLQSMLDLPEWKPANYPSLRAISIGSTRTGLADQSGTRGWYSFNSDIRCNRDRAGSHLSAYRTCRQGRFYRQSRSAV